MSSRVTQRPPFDLELDAALTLLLEQLPAASLTADIIPAMREAPSRGINRHKHQS